MQEQIIIAIIVSSIAFFSVYGLTPIFIKALASRNLTVKDVNKKGDVMIPRPGGIPIVIGLVAAEIALYAFFPISEILAVIIVSILGFCVGFVDDRKVMGGWFKPLALAFCASPILLLGAYDSNLSFPLFGLVQIPSLYLALVVFMIPITGNTINSIDVLNGVASGVVTIASFALAISLFIMQNYEIGIASLCLAFASLGFYKYHKFPSKIFPGDSGALVLGSTYGVIAIVGHVEVISAIAILPAVINSFLFLTSVKKIVEHREIKNPTLRTEDFKIKSTDDKTAPITLVRLLVAKLPLSEKQIGAEIFKLSIFCGILAVITAFFMEVKI
ncbi:MAG TPA: UDP-N-acetylglucosamine-1-phosphate transferase [Candidatus Nitrosopelagicus sp.]|nr:UDP-N-acetylglucosamine-1-phosphate transferase [Candidatus Nitrosopelagicus sp.]HJN19523.1 UDP-N-acetylglucosamine-1-phosphate transferase [Candidatus Nitrosopelagicus sp.]